MLESYLHVPTPLHVRNFSIAKSIMKFCSCLIGYYVTAPISAHGVFMGYRLLEESLSTNLDSKPLNPTALLGLP
jgi:hypothetical protein